MNCREIHKWLHGYLDARVDADQERMVERHIRACPFCRRRLVELARAVNLLEGERPVGAGPQFLRRVLASLPEAARPVPVTRPSLGERVAAWRRLRGGRR